LTDGIIHVYVQYMNMRERMPVRRSNSTETEQYTDPVTTLKILDAVERGNAPSQRSLARDAEIALGFANAYLRRCIRKGWVKVREVPRRRFLYYITPTGFMEKARLATEYLTGSLDMFRTARVQCDELFEHCVRRSYRRIALAGAGDLAEIAVLSALNCEIAIVAVVDSVTNREHLAGLRVVRDLDEAGPVDAIVITDMHTPQQTFDQFARQISRERVLTLRILRVNRDGAVEDWDAGESGP
jgi:DNA-binding MarR family transcriptional regulator